MILGIEIGGTKLQLGVGNGQSPHLVDLVRCNVDIASGAQGILRQVEEVGQTLVAKHGVKRVGVGFGGPVDSEYGRVLTSHQVPGWNNYPLVDWCRDKLCADSYIINDCDAAALAESLYGAGVGMDPVLYVTVGTGVGAGLVIKQCVYHGKGSGAAEIGHLYPEFARGSLARTVESRSSGPAIADAMRSLLEPSITSDSPHGQEDCLLEALRLSNGDLENLTAKDAGIMASGGDSLAQDVFRDATEALGWGIAQAVTLFAPECVVIGGGVSLAGEDVFFAPLRESVRRNTAATFRDSFTLKPAELGEVMVVYGAMTNAAHPPQSKLAV